jgi:hypothetical protein
LLLDANEGTSGSHGSRGPESDDEELAKKFRKNALKKKGLSFMLWPPLQEYVIDERGNFLW